MTDTIDQFAAAGLGTPAMARDIRNQHSPRHGDGNMPDDLVKASSEGDLAVTRIVDIVEPEVVEERDELTALRNRIRDLETQLESSVIENQMFRRFHGSKDDEDQRLFMQSVVFLASTALEFKMNEERIQEFFNGHGECLHPEDSLKDTGFGVIVCTVCKKHVEPVEEAPCGHENYIEYGTVGMKQCLICGTNLPRDHFTRLDEDQMKLADAVGVSIPKGQPVLNPGLAPRIVEGVTV